MSMSTIILFKNHCSIVSGTRAIDCKVIEFIGLVINGATYKLDGDCFVFFYCGRFLVHMNGLIE